jgi:hypothetical protein
VAVLASGCSNLREPTTTASDETLTSKGDHDSKPPIPVVATIECLKRQHGFDFAECVRTCATDRGTKLKPTCLAPCATLEKRALRLATARCRGDKDGDGIPDGADRCSATKPGVHVDWTGCPDRDGDGVPDGVDKCPGTPPDTAVAVNGCPVTATCQEGGHCETDHPVCRTQDECDLVSERPIMRDVPPDARRRLITKFLGSPGHDIPCPDDHRPPAQPHTTQPTAMITPVQVGQVDVTLQNGAAVSGPTVPLSLSWTAVADTCGPVTYSVLVEYYHCHQIDNVIEPVTYQNRGWCKWMPFTYESTTSTSFSMNFPMGTHLYNIHLPFASELGWDLTFTGTRNILYAPFWLRVRLFAHDGNGSTGGSLAHDEDRFFVLYADGTVSPESLTHIPIEP